MNASTLLRRQIDGGECRSDTARGEGSRVAMGEHARRVRQQGKCMFTDAPAHGTVFIENARRLRLQLVEDRSRIARSRLGHPAHALHRPRQIHGRGTYRANPCAQVIYGSQKRSTITRRAVTHGDDETHRAGNPDRRCAAHGKRSNRLAHVVDGTKLTADQLARQASLVDDVHRISIC